MKKIVLLTSMSLLIGLYGCGQKSPEELLKSADAYMAQSNSSAAIVELKTAIQQEPENAQARLALARIYLQLGDGPAAAKEFNRAIEFGMSNADIAAERVRADYLAGVAPATDILAGVTAGSPTADIVALYSAMIAFEQGQLADADKSFIQVAKSNSADISAFGSAYVSIMQKDLAKAVSALNTIPTDSPVYLDSLMLKARSYQALNELPKAIEALKIYTSAIAQSNIAKLMLADAYVRNSQQAEAEPIVDAGPTLAAAKVLPSSSGPAGAMQGRGG